MLMSQVLKLAELRNRMTPEQKARWEEVKKGFERTKMQGSGADDPATRVSNTLAGLAQRVETVANAIEGAAKAAAARPQPPAPIVNVAVPDVKAPVVNVASPTVNVSVPDVKAPVVNVAAPTVNVAAPAVNVAAPKTQVDPQLLARLDQVVQALEAAKIDVRLTSPAPAGIAELVRLQTILIEASLLPLVKGLASSIEHEKANANRLEEALEALKALDAKGLPAAQPAQTEVYRPFKAAPKGVRRDDE